ncbi:MAG: Rrf2 family transcriptional regulator [Schwartzia sp. (in: firmicutes)]
MQISMKFTIAIHILTATAYFSPTAKITSEFLADSVGSNPVIIRNIMAQLKDANLIAVKRGPRGLTLTRPLSAVTFFDVYKAVETKSDDPLFRFHEHPHPACPVEKNIHRALDESLHAVQRAFEQELQRHTLQEVYRNIE